MKASLGTFLLSAAAAVLYFCSMTQGKKVVCYYRSWAIERSGDGKCDVEDINPNLCTHINYNFIWLGDDNKVQLRNSSIDSRENGGQGAMSRFTGLKRKNPDLKALVVLGGWDQRQKDGRFSRMVSTPESRKTFIHSVIPLLRQEGFDGLDLMWEFPNEYWNTPEDKRYFVELLSELRTEFDKHGYLLTVAASPDEDIVSRSYDVSEISKHVDFINLMAYDFHFSEHYVHHHAPLFQHQQDASKGKQVKNTDHGVQLWLKLGAPAEKLVLGVPSYGRGFNLKDGNNHGIYAENKGWIEGGPYIHSTHGIWAYNEICLKIGPEQWTVATEDNIQVPYAYKGTQWIGYENTTSVAVKAKYVKDNNLAGVMISSVDMDDFKNKCGQGVFPLLTTIKKTLDECPVCDCIGF